MGWGGIGEMFCIDSVVCVWGECVERGITIITYYCIFTIRTSNMCNNDQYYKCSFFYAGQK